MNGLALQVQEALRRDPHAGDFYVFRGARGDLIKKILWHDGLGMSLYAKKAGEGSLHSGHRRADGVVGIWRRSSPTCSTGSIEEPGSHFPTGACRIVADVFIF